MLTELFQEQAKLRDVQGGIYSKLSLKSYFVILFFLLLSITLIACEAEEDIEEIETQYLNLRIVEIFDTIQVGPHGHDFTISACYIESDCFGVGIVDMDYTFIHLDLPDINVIEGDIITVEIPLERWWIQPTPVYVISWALYE